jgi:hypothetical protein
VAHTGTSIFFIFNQTEIKGERKKNSIAPNHACPGRRRHAIGAFPFVCLLSLAATATQSFPCSLPPSPSPDRTKPSRRRHKSNAIRNPGLIRSSPPSARLPLGSAQNRVNPSQRCGGWRISSCRTTSAAGRRQNPQGQLALLLLRFSLFACQAGGGGCVWSSE